MLGVSSPPKYRKENRPASKTFSIHRNAITTFKHLQSWMVPWRHIPNECSKETTRTARRIIPVAEFSDDWHSLYVEFSQCGHHTSLSHTIRQWLLVSCSLEWLLLLKSLIFAFAFSLNQVNWEQQIHLGGRNDQRRYEKIKKSDFLLRKTGYAEHFTATVSRSTHQSNQ